MFDAIVFLAGAVLFLLAVLYFVLLWRDRMALARRRGQLQVELATLKEQRVDLDIRERELRVWAEGLDHQQRAIAKAEQELRMLTASRVPPEGPSVIIERRPSAGEGRRGAAYRSPGAKNAKQPTAGKLSS